MVEHCCSNTNLLLGETMTGVSKDMDLTAFRTPLGVCAGIAPFNFPAMIPLWMFPMATICGNTYIMKPSERYLLVDSNAKKCHVLTSANQGPHGLHGAAGAPQGGRDAGRCCECDPRSARHGQLHL